ncbi:hypothetical protein BKA66DRAFT_443886 [Pyrenochaeta sp. MPI-SDFR-AT-0127]|nr:hypothetical protein BKA66DRAFT_443886 [Pyrenochaeta sp. MPI-SDFR-AT-0127]
MPQALLWNLHNWTKDQRRHHREASIPTEPNKHYLLGFPGVEAEHPKTYIRNLWLVAENDRLRNPKFLAANASELFQRTSKAISELVKDEDKLYKELASDAFLKAEVEDILIHEGFGELVWGSRNNAPELLSNKSGTACPKWAVVEDDGQITPIMLNVRYWMASRIQERINAPCEQKPERSMPRKRTRGGRTKASVPHQDLDARGSSQESRAYLDHWVIRVAKGITHHVDPAPVGTGTLKKDSVISSTTSYGPKDSSVRRLCSTDATSLDVVECSDGSDDEKANLQIQLENAAGQRTPSISNSTTETCTVTDRKLSKVRRKLQRSLTRMLRSDPPDYDRVPDIVQRTTELYALTIYYAPDHEFHPDFEQMGRALDYWATLVSKLKDAAKINPLGPEGTDCTQALLTQATFEDRLITLKTRKELRAWHEDKVQAWEEGTTFDLGIWTLDLALLFEGLLGTEFLPCVFEELVESLNSFNRALCGYFGIKSG